MRYIALVDCLMRIFSYSTWCCMYLVCVCLTMCWSSESLLFLMLLTPDLHSKLVGERRSFSVRYRPVPVRRGGYCRLHTEGGSQWSKEGLYCRNAASRSLLLLRGAHPRPFLVCLLGLSLIAISITNWPHFLIGTLLTIRYSPKEIITKLGKGLVHNSTSPIGKWP